MSALSRSAGLSRVLKLSTGAFRATGGFLRKRSWPWPVLAALLFGLLAWGVDATVSGAIKTRLHDELTTLLQADVKALENWIDLQEAEAQAIATSPAVKAAIAELTAQADAPADVLVKADALIRLRGHLRSHLEGMHYDNFLVVSPAGRVIAAGDDEWIGKTIAGYRRAFYDSVRETGKPRVSRPFLSPTFTANASGDVITERPAMVAAAVVPGETTPLAVLGLRIRPEDDFSQVLQVARFGKSGETYAFDRQGLLLSQSRFDDDLKRIGLIPDPPKARSILVVELRDPGVNMVTGERPTLSRAEQPLTVMAREAVLGRNGSNVEGYRDYRGVPVLGAWTWLDEHDFGIATEVDAAEAFQVLTILRYTTWGLIGLLALCALGLFVQGLWIAWQRRVVEMARQFGQYTLEKKIGEGGMGAVYKARHALLRRPTALKLFNSAGVSEAAVARFEREVQFTSQLNHPNTIAIFDFGRTNDGIFFYAMEYLDGISLEDLVIKHGPLPEGRVIHVLRQTCDALAEAHGVGLIHRDVKPANIVLNHRGGIADFVKVLDFGLVKPVGPSGQLTANDVMVGTPLYMAPEAIDQADTMDARSDIYALGAVAYFLVTGSPVFTGKTTLELCRQHLKEKPALPSERLGRFVSPDLEALLMSCLAKDPGQRPRSAAEMSDALGRCQSAGSWTKGDAEAWWQKHRPAVEPARQTVPSPDGLSDQPTKAAAEGIKDPARPSPRGEG